MLTISHRDMLQHVPGQTWLAPAAPAQDGISVSGFTFSPSTSNVHTGSHVIIVYRQHRSTMRRCIGGQVHCTDVVAGDISLKHCSSAGEWAWTDAIDVVHIYIEPALLDRVATELHGPSFGSFRLNDCVKVRDDSVAGVVHALADEAAAARAGSRLMARSLGLQLAVHLVRHHGQVMPALRTGGFDPAQCLRISGHIAAHLADDLSVEVLAELAGVSPGHFSRLFRASFDCAPHQYVLRARLEAACELLRDPARPMAEIAVETGFFDQSHLSRWFKQHYGQSPGLWRRQNNGTA
ncbi:AraC family transcriptional regulator [Hydrogenophaga sp.]|uniref:helix-turn-helix domain-containing protein n=1 Tax=Hydrogenophaga sp. TaxID=1904254 RepID=UPI002608BD20|nr:AraC family transcriptional regulator [Hydrogenophaga sp.]MCW5653214.1 helix-turn-helix transcriptional regulator [Hydrogenophaga sp.]